MRSIFAVAAVACLSCLPAPAEPIQFDQAPAPIECETITRSSFVNRICYADGQLVMLLRDTYYAYCNVPAAIVDEMKAAESIGRFYNQNIKNNAANGAYACGPETTKWTVR